VQKQSKWSGSGLLDRDRAASDIEDGLKLANLRPGSTLASYDSAHLLYDTHIAWSPGFDLGPALLSAASVGHNTRLNLRGLPARGWDSSDAADALNLITPNTALRSSPRPSRNPRAPGDRWSIALMVAIRLRLGRGPSRTSFTGGVPCAQYTLLSPVLTERFAPYNAFCEV
jgi:hypothetical protein